mgnify:FL=1
MNANNFKIKKAGTPLVLFLLFVLGSCVQNQANNPKEVGISWSEIDQGVGLKVGDILEVALPANPSMYSVWEVGFYNQSVLKPSGEPDFYSTSTNLGEEKIQKLHFEAIGEGETELVLVYQRSYENEGNDQQTFKVHVIVSLSNE